jgi:tRNA modification GTPase
MNFNTHHTDTIIALATPQGTGAIAVLRLSGAESIKITNRFFRGKDLEKQDSHTVHFGTIRNGTEKNSEIIDEVLVTLFVSPKSFTGETVVEISTHGSPYIVQKMMQLFIDNGVRPAKAGEFTLRAFLNGRMDLSQAEAVADLIAADSEASLQTALKQMRGGFSLEIKQLRQELINFASLIELELDFGEEDVEFANREQFKALLANLLQALTALINSFRLGNVLKKGVITVIAGRPNAGKSTLLNALLNEERAIVSEIAGTTRDTIEETLLINGIAFRLIDTAGIREATDKIEAIGVKRTMEKVNEAALLVYVYDIVQTSATEAQKDILTLLKPSMDLVVVANKLDLQPTYNELVLPQTMNNPEIRVAANNVQDIENLKQTLWQTVAYDYQAEQTLITNARHYEALQGAAASIKTVEQGLQQGLTNDLLALDIRTALHYLGEITGEITNDDLLANIFSKFCIGK